MHAREVDVTDEAAIAGAIDDAAQLMGGLDLALANAGIFSVSPLAGLSLAEFERTLEVNVLHVPDLQAPRPHLQAAGGGSLLCTASQAGVRGYRDMTPTAHRSSRSSGSVQSLAQELAQDGIRVCAVAPGITDTGMYEELATERGLLWDVDRQKALDRLASTVPLGRPASPLEVADAFVYLASAAAAYVSGIALVIDGGELS